MPRPFPSEFRVRAIALVRAGKPISQVAADLGISSLLRHRRRATTHLAPPVGLKPTSPALSANIYFDFSKAAPSSCDYSRYRTIHGTKQGKLVAHFDEPVASRHAFQSSVRSREHQASKPADGGRPSQVVINPCHSQRPTVRAAKLNTVELLRHDDVNLM